MTLREAVERVDDWLSKYGHWNNPVFRDMEALRLLLDTARDHLDDTAEIVLPCRTCGGKGEVVHAWKWDHTAAVSPCPTCSTKPVEA